MSSSPYVIDVTNENFERDVLEASLERPIVIDFWAEWCGPCRTLGPLLERLIDERDGAVMLAKINVDDAPDLARAFQISGIPAIRVIHQRQLVNGFEGLLPEATLRHFLNEIAPGSDPGSRAAQEAEQLDPALAEQRYRDLIAADSNNLMARVGLAELLFEQGRYDEIRELVDPVGTSGEAGALAERLLARLWLREKAADLPETTALSALVQREPKNAQARLQLGLRLADAGDYPEALASLLAAAELDFNLANGAAREAMVKVFYCLGTNHPLANDYRNRLARLLY
ncbi:MAG: tetratricopeptide repeat protein [Gemmataceae bacterium]